MDRNLAITKLNEMIDAGKARAARVVDHVMTVVPEDALAYARGVLFAAVPVPSPGKIDLEKKRLAIIVGDRERALHKNGLAQACQRTGVPSGWANETIAAGGWGVSLIAHALHEMALHSRERWLIRSVGDETRAILSDRYRRLDAKPLVEALATACTAVGAIPVSGSVTDTKVCIRAISTHIFEPVPGDPVVVGIDWSNSDFGNGAHALRAFLLRLWCANGATREDVLRQVHLGGRLDERVEYSQKTYHLDTRAVASALTDTIKSILGRESIEKQLADVAAANARRVDAKSAKETLKRVLGKGELDEVIEAFSSAEVEMLPPGQSAWRMSNALSWVAGKKEADDPERAMELQRLAGSWLDSGQQKAAA